VGVTSIAVKLYYQTASKEYITFLRDENADNAFDWNDWGESLYVAWERKGKSRPVIMDSITVPVISTDVKTPPSYPKEPVLTQNYPNPFNPSTTIGYSIAATAHVTLIIHDALGRKVATLVDELQIPGRHSVTWNASNVANQTQSRRLESSSGLATGIYYCRLTVGNHVETRAMVLLK
jgi:hypothetical protein